ncbi:glycosyltransferase family 4 protein [bacterium]|nr:glycosyltransferase family 4 protein [bacterium]NCQ55680.1 glycosyltransferase family 4 protein [Candidatus Parcubacteria bacterium]NCS67629.1 glycosyltransferase family 4 protein [Candidatus Peregrinibacteria bacterium]NCS96643.1 glycosyltransferase family 4 protein [bacterium]
MPKKSFKIGIDARMFSDAFTGIGRYNFELTKRLFKEKSFKDQSLEWVIFLNEPQFSEFEFPAHVKKVCVNAGHYSLAEQLNFAWLLYKEKCDLVHFSHFNLPLLYWRKFVVTIHDTTISFYPGKKMNAWWRKLAYKLVIRHAVKAALHIITVSEHTKKDVIKLFGTASEKISAIHIAPSPEFQIITDDEVTDVKQKFGLENFILYTGNWREHKNLVGLIEAFAALQKQPDFADLKLVITGKNDPHYPEVIETIKTHNIESSVLLVGLVNIKDLIALFNAAQIYVCPSFYEGFGLPPLEAMACGTPVAVSDAASLPEVCGKAAEYFNPHSLDDMTQVLDKLLHNREKQAALKALGLEHINNFSWDQTANKTLEVYKQALS